MNADKAPLAFITLVNVPIACNTTRILDLGTACTV